MAILTDLYIKTEVLELMVKTLKGKGDKGVGLTISIDDKENTYGQNVSVFVSQTKKQREDKAKRFYVGNGKVVWNDGKIYQPSKQQSDSGSSNPFGDDSTPSEDSPF